MKDLSLVKLSPKKDQRKEEWMVKSSKRREEGGIDGGRHGGNDLSGWTDIKRNNAENARRGWIL